ncbi:MAG: hypothetical protein HW391_519, partial [Chloroflexi bacterium]|nr:hypothetical protein [Chloroflexota bacterium]
MGQREVRDDPVRDAGGLQPRERIHRAREWLTRVQENPVRVQDERPDVAQRGGKRP